MNSSLLPNRGRSWKPAVLVAGFVMLVSILGFGSASNIYIAQNATGAGNGSDCADTYALSFFNTSGNWGSGSTQIGPGTTVHLCGTITLPVNAVGLTAHGAGTSGNPITIFFESGAQITSAGMYVGIELNGNSFFVVDGNGTNPSISNTANGTSLANQVAFSTAIDAQPCNGCEFKNITISNMYVHPQNPAGLADQSQAASNSSGFVINGSNYSIHDSTFDGMYQEIGSNYGNGDHNIQIYNNTFNHYNWGVHIGGNAPTSLDSVFLHDNHLQDSVNWDTTADAFHHDGLFVVQNNTSASVTNVFFYDNLADGVQGTCCVTAWIFFNTGMHGIYVFNNVLKGSGGFLVEAGFPGDTNYAVYNNYMDCNGGGGVNFSDVSGFRFENNAMTNCFTYIYIKRITAALIDYNAYAATPPGNFNLFTVDTDGEGWAQYRINYPSFDPHSIIPASLGVNALTGVPNAGSPIIHSGTTAFSNLSSLCTGSLTKLCTDRAGTARPTSGTANWDAGAYMFGASIAQPSPPSGLLATVQ
jgi:hypothetical protein